MWRFWAEMRNGALAASVTRVTAAPFNDFEEKSFLAIATVELKELADIVTVIEDIVVAQLFEQQLGDKKSAAPSQLAEEIVLRFVMKPESFG